MNCLIFNITNFHQELKSGYMKDQVGLSIQQCNINYLFQKLPCEGSSYFTLPNEVRNERINLQNEDNECFRWCLVRYLDL